MEWLTSEDSSFFSLNNSDIVGPMEIQFAYTFLEIIVAVVAVIGNGMVILVFRQEKRLRRRTNYYIVSLAVADLLVGLLGIPFAIMASVGLPTNLHACLFTVSLLVVLCTISIFCLVAVSVDRYWAILHPMAYSRNVRTKTTIVIISVCWAAGVVVGFLPLFGWHADVSENISCFFVKVMDYNYLVFLYFATIITPSLIMAAFYAHIYRVVVKQLKQIVTINPKGGSSKRKFSKRQSSSPKKEVGNCTGGGTMLRVLGAAQKREVKATQNLSIIVLFFMICWIPLYTINCIKAFCLGCHIEATWTDFCIILSHLNSAVNPILYAYHLKDFRAALKCFIYKMFGLKEAHPNENDYKPSIVSHRNMEKRYSNKAAKIYIDSPVWMRQQAAAVCESNTLLGALPIAESPRPAYEDFTEPCLQKRDMWMISEVPSISEKDACHDSVAIISQHDDFNFYSVNDADDDVFIHPPKDLIQYDFVGHDNATHCPLEEKPKSRCSSYESVCNISDNESDAKSHEMPKRNKFVCKIKDDSEVFFIKNTDTILQNEKVVNEEEFSSSVRLEFTPIKRRQKSECNRSPVKRQSPLKIVSDYFLNQSSSFNKNHMYNDTKARKFNCGSSDVFQYLDLHKYCTNYKGNNCEYKMDDTDTR